jgi:hypothetical protein
MSSNYKPGTVAAIRDRFSDPTEWRAVKDGEGWSSLSPEVGWVSDADVIAVRPLILLDVSAVDTYWRDVVRILNRHHFGAVAQQIEEQTTKPLSEPKGVGAVVEVDGGVRFVRIHDGYWIGEDESQTWDNLNPVRVLSEGVSA